ncbi:MAG: alpha/beta hydrolase, partial [Acidimicrobiaceae bacterium]|nr:alpha/beta hydrolase [Acidimicrobiaceae bacterium]
DLDTLVDDLATVVEDVSAHGGGGATVVGHSFGGQVAFGLAARRPELVDRLVLVGSNGVRASRSEEFPFGAPASAVLPGLLADEHSDRIASRRRTLASAFAGSPSEDLLAWLLATSLRMPTWAATACYRSMLTADLVADVGKVRQPVAQVVGSKDPMFSIKGARWLADALPDSRLVALEGCGHYPMFEAPDAFESALLDFVGAGAK